MRKIPDLPINIVSIAAMAIIVAFFLPWYSKFGSVYSGYEIPEIVSTLKQTTSFKSWTGRFDFRTYLIYSLYLIPFGALMIIVLNILRKNYLPAAWPTSILPLAGLVFGLIKKGSGIIPKIGIGGWITIVAALIMLLVLLDIIKLPQKKKQ